MQTLTPEQLRVAREVLLGPLGELAHKAMFDLNLGRPVDLTPELQQTLRQAGWLNGDNTFAPIGQLVADPLREYGFWLERNRELPSEDQVPALRRARFRNKQVLELGSGGGCNLLSLGDGPSRLVGIEPMALYTQLTPILAEMAGVPAPEVHVASAEDLPFGAASFDVCLCYSSHQYMNVDRALAEMARVLAPGGELIIVGNSLYPFAGESVVRFAKGRSLGTARYDLTSVLNTLSYQWLGRRIVRGKSGTTTSVPIYPSRQYMLKTLDRAGFTPNLAGTRVVNTGETVLLAARR